MPLKGADSSMTEKMSDDEYEFFLENIANATDPVAMLREYTDLPILFLLEKQFLSTARYLIDVRNVPLLNEINVMGEGVVHHVAQQQDLRWLKWLITHPDVDFFKLTDTSNNVIHYSAHITQSSFLDVLFTRHHETQHFFTVNLLMQMPLFLAIEYDNEIFLENFLKYFREKSLLTHNHLDQNILHCIAKFNAVKCYDKLKFFLTEAEFQALESALDVNNLKPIEVAGQPQIFQCMMGYCSNITTPSLLWAAAKTIVAQLNQQANNKPMPIDSPYLPAQEVYTRAVEEHERKMKVVAYKAEIYDQGINEYPFPFRTHSI